MCEFFSFCTDADNNLYYFDARVRKEILREHKGLDSSFTPVHKKYYEADSHTSIADYHGFKCSKEDDLNKWEYNPFTETLKLDRMHCLFDRDVIMAKLKALSFRDIVPELRVIPVENPFLKEPCDPNLAIEWAQRYANLCNAIFEPILPITPKTTTYDYIGSVVGWGVLKSVRKYVWHSGIECNDGIVRESPIGNFRAIYTARFFDLPNWDVKDIVVPATNLYENGYLIFHESNESQLKCRIYQCRHRIPYKSEPHRYKLIRGSYPYTLIHTI